jgi:hypothetical protein
VERTERAGASMSRKQKKRILYQPLTCIRQTGVSRQFDGTATYTFAAQVSKELAPVMITLIVTEGGEVRVQARFDETIRASLEDADQTQLEGRSA